MSIVTFRGGPAHGRVEQWPGYPPPMTLRYRCLTPLVPRTFEEAEKEMCAAKLEEVEYHVFPEGLAHGRPGHFIAVLA
jgi:hypothetical protein